MKHPKITVATVCYNASSCIEESIMSVVNQTYDNIEYVIVDGGSNDGTLEILEKYKSKISKLISEKDAGIYDAMNKVLQIATGDYLIFLGADDHFLSFHSLDRVAGKLSDANVVYYGNVYMEGSNRIYKGKFNKYKRAYFNYCHQGIFYPQNVYKKFKYDLKYKVSSDNDYNFRVAESFPFRYLGDTISFFSTAGTSAGKSLKEIDPAWYADKPYRIKKNLGTLPYLYFRFRTLFDKMHIL